MKFGLFRPGFADVVDPTILRQAVNVLYKPGGLGPVKSLVLVPGAEALPDTPRGGISGVTAGGVYLAFVGTETGFYRLATNGTWTDVSPGSPTALPAGDNWSFATIGKYIIATNRVDGMFYYDLDAGGVFTAISGAPVARICFRAFNALFAGDCDGDNRVLKSSKLFDPLTWTGPGTTYQEMQAGEEILGGGEISNNAAILIQRSGVTPMIRRADSKIYDMGTNWTGVGATNPEAIVFVRGFAVFLDTKGFYAAGADGVAMQIGDGKVDKWFLEEVSATGLDRVQGAYWPSENVVVFRYKSSGSSGGDEITDDGLIIDLGEATRFEFTQLSERLSLVVTMATPGYTLDDMDGFGTLDDMPQIALDSRFWFGGEPRMGGLDEDYKFGFFDGPNSEATIETSTTAGAASQMMNRLRALTDADDFEVYIGVSDDLSDALTWKGPFTKASRGGIVPVRARGKNVRFRLVVAAADDWTYAVGLEIDPGGANAGGQT